MDLASRCDKEGTPLRLGAGAPRGPVDDRPVARGWVWLLAAFERNLRQGCRNGSMGFRDRDP